MALAELKPPCESLTPDPELVDAALNFQTKAEDLLIPYINTLTTGNATYLLQGDVRTPLVEFDFGTDTVTAILEGELEKKDGQSSMTFSKLSLTANTDCGIKRVCLDTRNSQIHTDQSARDFKVAARMLASMEEIILSHRVSPT